MTTTSDMARLLMMQGTQVPDAGLGPVTNTTRAGRPNPMLTAPPNQERPADYMQPVAELLSLPMGAYGAGQLIGSGINAAREGDYASGAGQVALGMVGMLPMAPKGGKGIRAFHGSPHDFERFDMSKIGTGEGAQAYGHGLYFAENEGVAKAYREALSDKTDALTPVTFEGRKIGPSAPGISGEDLAARFAAQSGGNAKLARAHIRGMYNDPKNLPPAHKEAMRLLTEQPERFASAKYLEPGHMYEVNIKADPQDFLDWYAPTAGATMERVAPLGVKEGATGYEALQQVAAQLARDGKLQTGKDLSVQVSESLRDAGIPGIRYLDQMSRGAGKGSSNYVVFDENLIEILRKYGLLGPVAGGGTLAGMLMGGQDGETY